MRISCPFCHSEATLSPNPAHAERVSLPLYLLTCSGCVRTSVRQENQELPFEALVRNRLRNSVHELTVAGGVGHTSSRTDPTMRTTPIIEHSALLEYVTSRINASDAFSLILRTREVGSRFLSPEGGNPYTAVRGWVVTNGEIHALTGQEVWEASSRDSESGDQLDPEAGFHYVDADDIPWPYPW